METTALGAYVLTRVLQSSGMTISDINIVSLEAGEHQNAYENGVVDAVVDAGALFDSRYLKGIGE